MFSYQGKGTRSVFCICKTNTHKTQKSSQAKGKKTSLQAKSIPWETTPGWFLHRWNCFLHALQDSGRDTGSHLSFCTHAIFLRPTIILKPKTAEVLLLVFAICSGFFAIVVAAAVVFKFLFVYLFFVCLTGWLVGWLFCFCCCFHFVVLSPQWGTADAEIKVPSGENTELKRSPFQAWSRSVYNHTCYAYCQGVLPCLFLPFQSIHLHFFQNLSQFFPVLACRIK